MDKVTRDQFEFLENIQVRHLPTGATFATYNYPDPNDVASSMWVNPGRAGEVLEDGSDYDLSDIQAVAKALLKERASLNAKQSESQ